MMRAHAAAKAEAAEGDQRGYEKQGHSKFARATRSTSFAARLCKLSSLPTLPAAAAARLHTAR